MTLAKAKALAKAKVKHIYSTGIIYDHDLRLSKYFYNTGHWCQFHQHFMNSFCAKILLPKITNPNCKHIKAEQKTFVQKAARKILVILTLGVEVMTPPSHV